MNDSHVDHPLLPSRRRQYRKLAGGLLLLLLLVISMGYGFLSSQPGLQWIATAINRWSGDSIRLSGIHGTLRDMRIETLHIQTDGLKLSAQNINFVWNPTELLQRQLVIDQLSLGKVNIDRHLTEVANPQLKLPERLRLPFGLSIMSLNAGSVYFNDAEVFSKLILAFHSDGLHHRITQLNIDTPWGHIESHAVLNGDAPFSLFVRAKMATIGAWGDIDATIEGDLALLSIEASNAPSDARMQLQAQLQPFATNPVTQFHAIVEQWNPADFLAGAPQAELFLSTQLVQNQAGQLEGNINIQNSGVTSFDRGGIPVTAINTSALITQEFLNLSDINLQLESGGIIRGALALDWKTRLITSVLSVKQLNPQQLDSRLQPAKISGNIKLSGDTDTQSAQVDLHDRALRINANITRTEDLLVLEQFQLQRKQSQLIGQGKMQLDHEQSFELSGQLINFNSADFIQAIDSKINATLQLSGQLIPVAIGTLKYAIQKSHLAKSPVSGAGEIAFTGLENFNGKAELLAGSNRLLVQGRVSDQHNDVRLTIDAPALAQLGLGLSGDLQTELAFRGSIKAPNLNWKLASRQLGLPNKQQLSGVSASAQWRQDSSIDLNIAIDSYETYKKTTFRQLIATLDGKTTHHRLTVKTEIDKDIAVQLIANGSLRFGESIRALGWDGQLTEFSVSGNMPLRLAAPAAFSLGAGSILLKDARFSVADGSVRINQLHWASASWKTSGDFSGIAVLPGESDRLHLIPLQLGGYWDLNSTAQLTGELQIRREQGDWYLPGDIPQPLGLQQLQLQLTALANKLTGQFELNSQAIGTAKAVVTLPLQRTRSQWFVSKTAPLQGNIHAAIANLRWLKALLGGDMHVDGEMQIQAGIHGTLEQPDISGTITGSNLHLVLLEHGIHLQQGTLAAHFQHADLHIDRLHFTNPHAVPPDNRLFQDLELKNANGSLNITGKVGLDRNQSQLDFSIEQLPLAHKSDYWIVASGAGALRLQHNQLSITGDLRSDAGLIMQPPKGRPELSDDIVLVNTPPQRRSQKMPLHLDMTLNLGEKFYIRAAGLEGRLAGQLQISNDDSQKLKVNGIITAQDAAFKAYGQNLSVKRGVVSFQGPLDDPSLNVLALREGLAVEAGVEITGSVRHPFVKLVSTPDVPDTEKLSWIVLGRKPDISGLDSSVLLSAAGSILGGQSSSGITDRITQALGVDEITFKQAGIGSSLSGQIGVIGKRISSRAYMSYERGLTATTMGIAKLNYNLTPRITIVTQAGEDSAVDLFYNLQFD